jgi:hypothetical protein
LGDESTQEEVFKVIGLPALKNAVDGFNSTVFAYYDLLAEEHGEDSRLKDIQKVSMLEDEDGNFHFRNSSVHQVANEEVGGQ